MKCDMCSHYNDKAKIVYCIHCQSWFCHDCYGEYLKKHHSLYLNIHEYQSKESNTEFLDDNAIMNFKYCPVCSGHTKMPNRLIGMMAHELVDMERNTFIKTLQNAVKNGQVRPWTVWKEHGGFIQKESPFMSLKIKLENIIEMQSRKIKELENKLKSQNSATKENTSKTT